METYPNGMMRIDRENGGYDYSAADVVVDAIVGDLSPKTIVLFGSVARGTADGDSDMDLMVVMDTDEKHTRRSSDVQMACGGGRSWWMRTSSWSLPKSMRRTKGTSIRSSMRSSRQERSSSKPEAGDSSAKR